MLALPLRDSRRQFLKTAAATAAATTLPGWFLEQSAPAFQPPASANDRPGVALVGCGGMGRGDAGNASRFGQILAVCDVDELQLAEARKLWPMAQPYKDFREVMDRQDIDVVICATVDHWHTLVSLAALRSGKDVYCEKPLTLTVEEGQYLVKAVQETGQILQTGSQQRSDKSFRLACTLVRNGRIGTLKHISVWLPHGRREGPFTTAEVPQTFDWDMWQGPTPKVDYIPERTHVTFRYWWEYSGGTLTDWGAHHNDIALWGLGPLPDGPITIEGRPLVEMIPGGFTASSEYHVTYTYANGVTHTCQSTKANIWNGALVDPEGQPHGVKFEGTDGWIWVTRGAIEASDPELLTTPLPSDATLLYASDDHMGNFFACSAERKPPICDAETGHRSAALCHLGAIAIRLGRRLSWNPQTELFENDDEANAWLRREMREPWKLS